MSDSLGGLLTGGMLSKQVGGMIIGSYGFWGVDIEIRDYEPGGGTQALGGRPNNLFAPARDRTKKKLLTISIRHQGEITRKTFEISDRTARVSINTLKVLTEIKEAAIRVFVREKKEINPVVRIKNDRD